MSLTYIVPLQLIAYYTAIEIGDLYLYRFIWDNGKGFLVLEKIV